MCEKKSCTENQRHILCSVMFFFSWRSFCLWDNVEKCGIARQSTDDNTMYVRRMRTTRWITKATNTRSECGIFTAFPWQQWSPKRDSMLRLYIHCLSFFLFKFQNLITFCWTHDKLLRTTCYGSNCLLTAITIYDFRYYAYTWSGYREYGICGMINSMGKV